MPRRDYFAKCRGLRRKNEAPSERHRSSMVEQRNGNNSWPRECNLQSDVEVEAQGGKGDENKRVRLAGSQWRIPRSFQSTRRFLTLVSRWDRHEFVYRGCLTPVRLKFSSSSPWRSLLPLFTLFSPPPLFSLLLLFFFSSLFPHSPRRKNVEG